MPLKVSSLFVMGAGAIIVLSGAKGWAISKAFRDVISGQNPGANPIYAYAYGYGVPSGTNTASTNAAAISAATGVNQAPPSATTVTALKAYAVTILTAHGWPGQFPALNNIVNAESSWNPNALNPSGAYGIAQALGHGTATTKGTVTNEYGNYGTSDSICVSANSGSGTAQLEWMLNYIGQRYGNPNNAWSFHQAHGFY